VSRQSKYFAKEAQVSLHHAIENFINGNIDMEITYLKQAKGLIDEAIGKALFEKEYKEHD